MGTEALNELEQAMDGFAADASQMNTLAAVLLRSEIYLIHYDPVGGAPSALNPGQGTTLSLSFTVLEGAPYLAFFSSRSRLEHFTHGRSSHYRMPAMKFLKLTRGADVCLDPESDRPLVLSAADVDLLLKRC